MVKGRVALVTGGGSGIGRGIALGLADKGVRVAVCGRRAEFLEQTVARIREHGGIAMGVSADVTNRGEVERLVASVVNEWGQIDILVNNAGVSGRTPMDDPDDTRWLNILAVNLTGSYLCSKVVLPHMKDPAYGRILNMSSVLGRFGVPGYGGVLYCQTRHTRVYQSPGARGGRAGHYGQCHLSTWVDTDMARQGIEEIAVVLGDAG